MLSGIFGGLGNPEHRRSFALMKRMKELPTYIATMLRATGYQVGASLSDMVGKAAFLLRMALVTVHYSVHGQIHAPRAPERHRRSDGASAFYIQLVSILGGLHICTQFELKQGRTSRMLTGRSSVTLWMLMIEVLWSLSGDLVANALADACLAAFFCQGFQESQA